MSVKTIISDCMLCVWDCGIKAHLEDGRLIKVEGLPEHPVSRGYICPRGEALPDYVYSSNRLRTPMLREKGYWQRVNWDTALDYCAEKLTRVKEKYDAKSLAVFCGSVGVENIEVATFARRFKGAFGTPNLLSVENICYRARILARQLTFGRYPLDDPKDSRCIVLWGHNPDGSKGMLGELIREKLAKEGLKLIVINPKRIPLAEETFHLPIRPGTDMALALAMINVIIKEDLYDHDFVKEYTVGFDELVKHVENYTPEWAQEITWLPASDIITAARMFAQVKPGCIIQGINSLDQHRNGLQNSRILSILQAITGNVFKPGSWVTVPRIPLTNLSFKDQEKPIGADDFPVFSSLWGRQAPFGIATLFPEAVLEGKPYPVRACIVTAANPVVSFPAAGLFKKAFAGLDFLAVIDPFFSETAELADVVLPACTFLEKGGLSYVYGVVFGEPFAMLHHKVIEPISDSWPDWKIWSELARRLGLGEYFPWQSDEEVMDAFIEPGDFKDQLKASPLGTYYGEKQYNVHEKKKLGTPSGIIELYSQTLKDYGYDPIPVYMEPYQSPVNTPELYQKYPLILISGERRQEYTHTQQRHVPVLRNSNREPLAEIHPATASQYGVLDYSMIRVETKSGSMKLRACLTEKIAPGVVSVPHGWADANVNLLVDMEAIDPITAYPDFKAVLCRIESV
ncbi:MAG: Acetylene hydratase [Pelotomaculum sp. PtaB.Bin013]|uniref:Molybdopterin-dependent oxidoreductase n=1 Tax=Pelotomaculum isophthalicicum JI TaxID=947010 RepID=A0A9X4H893_9FIRM|nr:molybdopterin-dependent oxidoreductase [Pelotomaculum isophthalicicum]MDF9408719.1 molybdopterin-dependent oxidoreductase [Pelotomaculum isophthalicicum JI]OPX81238.1 MAG: Acetylene hydratase [Pelotomaculum sp. PtaB.Bin013]